MATKKHSIGVIVGRFQVPSLTEGHKEIFEHCLAQGHETNIVFLGIPHPDVRCTKNNPIPYAPRKQMIEDEYGSKFIVAYIKDVGNDEIWSRNLDNEILTITNGDADVVLYGSRQSFISHYKGRFDTEEYKQRLLVAGTEIRANAQHSGDTSLGFRLGVVYATQKSWTNYFPTVDCAIAMDKKFEKFLFAKKSNEKLLRFVGGFWDPVDNTVEDAAIREAKEETNLSCHVDSYICTAKIDDPRYRNEKEKIMTTMYLLTVDEDSPDPRASDDIAEVHVLNLKDVTPDMIVEAHRGLLDNLKKHILTKNINA